MLRVYSADFEQMPITRKCSETLKRGNQELATATTSSFILNIQHNAVYKRAVGIHDNNQYLARTRTVKQERNQDLFQKITIQGSRRQHVLCKVEQENLHWPMTVRLHSSE